MADSIVHSTGEITPKVINGYTAAREARTQTHIILGKPSPDVTLRKAGLRTGELVLVFATEAEARAAEVIVATPQILSLETPDTPTLAMEFVVAGGSIRTDLDPQTRKVWIVTVPFEEVGA